MIIGICGFIGSGKDTIADYLVNLHHFRKESFANSLKDAVNFIEQTSKCSQLNPRFVAEMMGFPVNWTELPFQSGEQSPSKDMETQ